jgi:hypothetical protein
MIIDIPENMVENVEEVDLSVFDYSLAKGADAEKVKNLQIILKEM